MGLVEPQPGYLEGLRAVTAKHGTVLIFDEVMTGFRVAYGGAQARYNIAPDLTTIGKVIGGGLPAAAFGGRAEIMQKLAPLGPVYQAGTLSGNPLAVAAGLKTLEILRRPGTYERLEALGAEVEAIFRDEAARASVACTVQRVGTMLTVFFTEGPVRAWDDAARCDRPRFARFHGALLEHGVYFPPSQFEAAFVSLAHDDDALETTRRAAQAAFRSL
jgi:glutamate-1-semialdehyde 2,1-aminomutase